MAILKQCSAGGRQLVSWGWGIGLAATLAVAVLMALHWKQASRPNATAAEQSHAASFEIDGETFLALPYSNPDLPLTAPRIVQMQVSLASLENAQLEFEPVSEEGSSAGSVLANVLVGADGQPLGIHILGLE